MARPPASPVANVDHARYDEVVRWWQAFGFAPNTVRLYGSRLRVFLTYCKSRRLVADEHLTKIAVSKFARSHARKLGIDLRSELSGCRVALHAWARGLAGIGCPVPEWVPVAAPSPREEIIEEYLSFRHRLRGVARSTLYSEGLYVKHFLRSLKRQGRPLSKVRLSDVDRFVAEMCARWARPTVRLGCGALRSFLRFLYVTKRIPTDLSPAVLAPRARAWERPPRFLPWVDVQRIMRGIDQSTPVGSRDFALLLLMASYGLRASEALRLRLEHIDWKEGSLHILRPKTGAETWLPLLPAVARALATYLQRGRSRRAVAREVFLRSRAPYCRLTHAGAVCNLLARRAADAGVSAPYLGSHVLRHSHATRQVDAGVSAKIVGDILGHARPASTSVYVRVALRRLRALALPVPR